MKYLFTGLIILTAACGQDQKSTPSVTVDQEPIATDATLHQYVEQFITDAKAHGVNVNRDMIQKVEMVDLIGNDKLILGFCRGDSEHQIIQIRKGMTVNQMKVTVYHEMGHCVLGEPHSTDIEDIMYEIVSYRPLNHWQFSIDKLFSDKDTKYVQWTTIED